ncbi:MAG: hypothetical protein LBW77_00095, partial [Verrucomicrobiota bacterium]|nr:hypothetical protein [Verrucomicrobiota bacterium]
MNTHTSRRTGFDAPDQVFTLPRLRQAWEAVVRKNGAPGCDGVSLEAFGRSLNIRLAELRADILSGDYHPAPMAVFQKTKPDGGTRELGSACVRDRVAA